MNNKSQPVAKLPILSIVVIVYKMRRQAMNTLKSLTSEYQFDTSVCDYEVLVVENSSQENLDEAEVLALGDNFHYQLREEHRPTPVYAANEGMATARGQYIALMIDGARMLSPGVIKHTLAALRAYPGGIVATPGFHIGEQDQRYSVDAGHDENTEQAMLDSIDWFAHGYRLFDISLFSLANDKGYFHPLLESNCIVFSRKLYEEVGGMHEGFQNPGGGCVNLDFYRQLALEPDSTLIVLAGEGSFHQYHGGVTTMQHDELDSMLQSHHDELKRIRGEYYKAVRKEPVIFGAITRHSLSYLEYSSRLGIKRMARFAGMGESPWDFKFSQQRT
ncbi:MAG: glycosyltransferase [Pseudomonadota bacterium]